MNLLIDLGNSYCKWAVDSGSEELEVSTIHYALKDTIGRVEAVLQAIKLSGVKQIHAVSVLGQVFEDMLAAQLNAVTDTKIKFYRSQKECFGVTLSYTNQQSYGADRYAAVVAAHHRLSGDKIVIDCGTATTIDVIDEQGNHAGGLIMPGIDLMVETLVNKATGIPMSQANQTIKLLCDNTEDAVYSGCASMMQHGLNGIIQQLTKDIEQETSVIITGGASHLLTLDAFENVSYVQRPHIVLEGLQVMRED